jgi:CRP-like cAMP-binding protein
MFDHLKNSVDQIYPLPDEDFMALLRRITVKKLKKHEFLLREGEVCNHIAFINSGFLRIYHNKEGKEHTTHFYLEGKWISNYASFLNREPSLYFIEAQTDSELFLITYNDLNRLYDEVKMMDRFGRLVAERLFLATVARHQAMVLQTPEERYRQLLNDQPHIFQIAPLKHIASFLGVEPESLSRIRKRLNLS